jgi:hypothetical protein
LHERKSTGTEFSVIDIEAAKIYISRRGCALSRRNNTLSLPVQASPSLTRISNAITIKKIVMQIRSASPLLREIFPALAAQNTTT